MYQQHQQQMYQQPLHHHHHQQQMYQQPLHHHHHQQQMYQYMMHMQQMQQMQQNKSDINSEKLAVIIEEIASDTTIKSKDIKLDINENIGNVIDSIANAS